MSFAAVITKRSSWNHHWYTIEIIIQYLNVFYVISNAAAVADKSMIYNQINNNSKSSCPPIIEIDQRCASKFLYFGSRQMIPAFDEESYLKNCQQYENGMLCLGSFLDNDCLHGIPRIAAEIIYHTVKKQFKNRCENPDIKKEFIRHSQCLRNQTILEQFHHCGDRYFAMTSQIKLIDDEDLYTPASCCLMVDFQKCIEEKNQILCNDNEDNGKFWTKVFDEISGETAIYCMDYETYENCKKNFPQQIWFELLKEPIDQMDQITLEKHRLFRSLFFTNVNTASKFQLEQLESINN